MKTQISRDSYRPEKRYSGVYQQQGRMITDADWNELVDVGKGRLDDALGDAMDSGVPRGTGVEIRQAGAGQLLGIKPGRLYAGGVMARVTAAPGLDPEAEITLGQQADLPLPPGTPVPNAGYVVYADVWERALSSLEDPEHLRDPALHGADTCSRTQTMAQLKWCDAGMDPSDEAVNPRRGDARLGLEQRSPREEGDPCDPCADVVGIDARTGNYLFRVEIHDVEGPPGSASGLTLKWSRENGAEEYEVDPLPPPEFREEGWIFEFFDDLSEKHPGVHLASGLSPARGRILESYPADPPPGFDRVRRWDGFCVLGRQGRRWVLREGRDRGVELSTGGDADANGHTSVGSDLGINLEALKLTLSLDGARFVAGDYWLAPVREAIASVGGTLLDGAPPAGVVHHYLRLAEVDAAGALVDPTGSEGRRLAFPPLTDLRAGDVGYEAAPDCVLLEDAQNVQQALDELCRRPSSGGGGCEVTVGKGGEFPDLIEAIETLIARGERDLSLCLLPGDHGLERPLSVENNFERFHLRLAGSGSGTRLALTLSSSISFVNLDSLTLADFTVALSETAAITIKGCREVVLEGMTVGGPARQGVAGPLRRGAPLSITGAETVRLTGNQIRVLDFARFDLSKRILVGSAAAARLFDPKLQGRELVATLGQAARSMSSLNQAARRTLIQTMRANLDSRGAGALSPAEKEGFGSLVTALSRRQVSRASLAASLEKIRRANLESAESVALLLGSASEVTVTDNRIDGHLALYEAPGPGILERAELKRLRALVSQGAIRFEAGAGNLTLTRNRIGRLVLGSETIRTLKQLAVPNAAGSISGAFYGALLTDNRFVRGNNQLMAKDARLTSNLFLEFGAQVGFVIAETALYLGNGPLVDPDMGLANVSRPTNVNLRRDLNSFMIFEA